MTSISDSRRIRRRWLSRLSFPLLSALAAHLVFMVTPAHAAMLAPAIGVSHHESALEELSLGTPHASHCVVEWSAPARPVGPDASLLAALGVHVPVPVPQVAGRPLPQAIGPPQQADAQALLQVFRI